MPYLGNDLQVAQPSYRNIDDISGSFNSSTTSFPLLVSGSAPVPFPINSNQCLISVAGVVQRPDDSGTEGFRISGGNIIFSSAPSTGADFFGVILAGADYVNVGANFPSGSAAVPSITFDSDLDTGIYNSAANQVSITTAGIERLRVDSSGQIESVSLGSASAPAFSFTTDPNTGIYSPGADQVAISTNGAGRLFITSAGLIGIGQSSPGSALDVAGEIRIYPTSGAANLRFGSGGAEKGKVAIDSSSNYIVETAGSERLRITSAGLVGVGTSSPGGLLHVSGGRTLLSSSDGYELAFARTGNYFYLYNDGGNLSGKLSLTTSAGAGGGEIITFTQDTKRVGVGTTSPLAPLHVEGEIRVRNGNTGDSVIKVGTDPTGNRASYVDLIGDTTYTTYGLRVVRNGGANGTSQLLHRGTGDYQITAQEAGAIAFLTTNAERARIDSSGRLGIGTSSPSGTLEVGAVSGAVTAGDLTVTTGSTTATVTIGRLSSTGSDNTIFNIRNRVGTSALYMNSGDGRLGIGTTSPLATIEIAGASECLRVRSTTASNNYITHKHTSSGDIAYLGAGGGAALSSGAATDYAIRANQGALLFATNGDNERARIDSSGRLLVGTSTNGGVYSGINPQIQLEGTSYDASTLSVYCNNNTQLTAPVIIAGKSRGAANGAVTIVQNGDRLGALIFTGADGTNRGIPSSSIEGYVDGTPGTSDMPGRLVFSTTADGASSPTERMRIGSDGYLNTFSSANGIVAKVSAAAGTSTFIYAGNRSATNNADGTTVFYVYSNGNVQNTNGSYTTISDVKLKENIVAAGSQWADLKAIQIRNWNFKAETGYETHRQIGPIAQELETVCPGLVFETPDRDEDGNETGEVTKGVNQSVLYMKAVKALQEAMERIETLEQRLDDAGIN